MNFFLLSCVVTIVLFEFLRAQEIFETVEAVVGRSVDLPCNVTSEKEGDKLSVLAWYKNGSSTAIYSRDLRNETDDSNVSIKGRYRLGVSEEGLASLQIGSARPSDAGLYYCLADFAASPAHKTHVHLVIIEPPQRLWVVHENGTRVASATTGANVSKELGPYLVGDEVRLFCVAFGGKPRPQLSWWDSEHMLKDSSTPLSEQRVRSDLRYGPLRREDHGQVLSCRATNSDQAPTISVDIVIDMTLPPDLVALQQVKSDGSMSAMVRVIAGEPLVLQCRVLGARPAPALLWRLDDGQLSNLQQNITKEPAQRLLVSEVTLSVLPEHDETRVSCCAPANTRDGTSYVCAPPVPISVTYLPSLQVESGGAAVNGSLHVLKGSNVTLNCSFDANPSIFELIWYHEDEALTSERSVIERSLQLSCVGERDAGEYSCAATNELGSTTSEPVFIDVIYPPFCINPEINEYGLGGDASTNLTCRTQASPPPSAFRWVLVNAAVNASTITDQPCTTVETAGDTLLYQRPNDTTFTTIFCWGINGVDDELGQLPNTPCTFLITDQTAPHAPTDCVATMNLLHDITVTCREGNDGGLSQKFTLNVESLGDSSEEKELRAIISSVPQFTLQEPSAENYKFVIISTNEKGDSHPVEINKEDIVSDIKEDTIAEATNTVTDITMLSLALCGGVALIALAACGLVLCAHDKSERGRPLHDRHTEESNCETGDDSDGSEYNLRRTESFRRAVSRYPTRSYDMRRSSSLHSARCVDAAENVGDACGDRLKRAPACRVHSMQNICRKRDMDALCDHLVLRLPPEPAYSYNVPRPVNSFYTMPRKMRHKSAKEVSDETSEIMQMSDGFSLPPPPDEFTSYSAGTRISARDLPPKVTPTYSTINRNNSAAKDTRQQYNNVIISPMNTVGLPTISGTNNHVYTYPDDDHQVNTNPFDSD